MVKNTSPATQKRKPRLLWANPFCLMDTSSGASMTVRQMLLQLVARGYEVQVLGATIFDNPKGMGRLKEQYPDLSAHQHQLIQAEDGPLTHQLVVSYSYNRNHFTTHEEGLWYSQYLYMLDSFKPDVVWFYGGQTLDMLIADEARDRGIPVAFYLANGNYKASRWCRDVDLILTDSQATADMYRKEVGYTAKPVGKFIASESFIAEQHERKRLLFVNPSWQKGASIFVQLAEKLERERPDIELEVVEARADWHGVLRDTTKRAGKQRTSLSNVTVTPNTSDMRGPYSRACVLIAPSLWWESSGRVLAEAMLNGIPALITNRGGMPEMIGNAGIAFDFPKACYEEPYQHVLSDEELQPLFDATVAFYDDEVLYQDYVNRAKQVGEEKHHIDRATERLVNALTPLVKLHAGNKDFSITQRKRHRQRLASRANKPEFKVDKSLQQLISAKPGEPHVSEPQATRLWLTDNFTWQIKGKIVVLDNRASLIKSGLADQMADTGAFGIVAFDPASEVKDAKQYEGSEYIQLFQHALLGDGREAILHACVAPEMTGTLAPLPPEKLPKRHHLGAQPLAELPINTITLDSITGLDSLDWLVLDELSDAMAVLENGKKSLVDTLLIQARVTFQPTHERQPSMAELQHWASRNGFRFYRMHNLQHYSHLPESLNAVSPCATEQESADVLFLPSYERMAAMSDENKTRLAFIMSTCFGAHDIAFELMADVSDEKALELLEAQNILPKLLRGGEDSVEENTGVSLSPEVLKVESTKEVVRIRDFLYEEARRKLTEFLNDYHGLSKGKRFWDICLHYFLGQRFVSSYLSRWNNRLLNQSSDNSIGLIFPCADLMEFGWNTYGKVGAESPFFASHCSRIASLPARKLTSRHGFSKETYLAVKRYLKKAVGSQKSYAFDLGLHGHEYWKKELSVDGVNLLKLPPFWVEEVKGVDFKARSYLAELDLSYPLENFEGFWSSLAMSLPSEFMEFFPELLKKSESLVGKYSPAFVFSTQLADSSSRILAALYADKGVPLHLQQHGGAYGEYPSHIGAYEIRLSDVFYTWGWGKSKKLQPAPAHRLESLEVAYKKISGKVNQKDEILIIGPHRPRVPSLYQGTDNDPSGDEELFEFLKRIEVGNDEKVVFRYRRQHGFDERYEKEIASFLPKGAVIDNQNRSIAEAYAKAKKVVIVDPFTTSAWECDYLKIPFCVLAKPSNEFMDIPAFIPVEYE
ncbi:glycosyltransferase [Halomonas sp.]|uniref:glycosyltransferase n=1 Tax=Halomonas sp. TaxID=1486246 RepID=UPI003A9225F8